MYVVDTIHKLTWLLPTDIWLQMLVISDCTRSTRLRVSEEYGWSPLHIWRPKRLLCLLYTLFCTSQKYSLNICLSILHCAYVKPILEVVFGLSLTLQYWVLLCRNAKPASCKYFNRNAHRMHGCCCHLVFVIDVSLCSIQYLEDF